MFPFTYIFKKYDTCIPSEENNDIIWCLNMEGQQINCSQKHDPCRKLKKRSISLNFEYRSLISTAPVVEFLGTLYSYSEKKVEICSFILQKIRLVRLV